VPLVTRRSAVLTLRRGERVKLRANVPAALEGPLPAGSPAGTVDVLYLGRPVRTLGLVTTQAVPGSSLFGRISHTLGPPLTALALILLVLGGVLVGFRLRSVFSRGERTVSSR
jgi:hypothetical protein